MRHRTSPRAIGFDLGLTSSQTAGPRGQDELGPIMVSTFYSGVLGKRTARPAAPAARPRTDAAGA